MIPYKFQFSKNEFEKLIKLYNFDLLDMKSVYNMKYTTNFNTLDTKTLIKAANITDNLDDKLDIENLNDITDRSNITFAIICRFISDMLGFCITKNKYSLLKSYNINLPEIIYKKRNLPIKLDINCNFKCTEENVFVVLESKDSCLFYSIKPKIHIVLDNVYLITYIAMLQLEFFMTVKK